MNPVKELIEKLSPTKAKYGVVQSVGVDAIKIAVNGVVETWPMQVGLMTGDSVVIYEGRVIKSVGIRATEVFEV